MRCFQGMYQISEERAHLKNKLNVENLTLENCCCFGTKPSSFALESKY